VDFDRVIERRGTGSTKWDRYSGDVLPLWVADMDFASPPAVVAALRERVEHGVFGYALVPESLIAAIQEHLLRRYGWRIEPEWLVFLPGAVAGLNLACKAVGVPGDEVMTVTPVYPPFLAAPRYQDRRLITVPAVIDPSGHQTEPARSTGLPADASAGRWQLPLAAMEAAVTSRTRLLLFCHPHNPLGRVWSLDEVRAVVDFCARHDLVLCSDELHCDLILDSLQHVPAATLGDDAAARTITIMSPSKTFNVAGLQFAYGVVPDPSLRRCFLHAGDGLMEPDYPGWFAIAAAEAAYRGGAQWHADLLDYLRGNRDLLERFVHEQWPRVRTTHVEATYLAWLDVRALGLEDPARACLEAGVALSDGKPFGAPGFLRINFGCPRSTLREALNRLADVLR
jgi:cystathionine beta-lyase